jgi:hypothetical protein
MEQGMDFLEEMIDLDLWYWMVRLSRGFEWRLLERWQLRHGRDVLRRFMHQWLGMHGGLLFEIPGLKRRIRCWIGDWMGLDCTNIVSLERIVYMLW